MVLGGGALPGAEHHQHVKVDEVDVSEHLEAAAGGVEDVLDDPEAGRRFHRRMDGAKDPDGLPIGPVVQHVR